MAVARREDERGRAGRTSPTAEHRNERVYGREREEAGEPVVLGLREQNCYTSTVEGMDVTRTTFQSTPATTPEACRSGTVVVLEAGVDVQLDRGIDGRKDRHIAEQVGPSSSSLLVMN